MTIRAADPPQMFFNRAKSGAEDPTADPLGLDANAENQILFSLKSNN